MTNDIYGPFPGGADFAAVAKEKSEDKGSGANGGELGWFAKDVMVKEFADAAFAMKVDEISQAPVKSQFGYHIIKVQERRTQPAPTLDSQKEQIRAELSEETVQALVKTLREAGIAEGAIQTQSVNLWPQHAGGERGEVPRLVGYQAQNSVEVRVDEVGDVGRVLDRAIAAGGNTLEGVSFELADPKPVQDRAREAAARVTS